jgi:hypothetical protein
MNEQTIQEFILKLGKSGSKETTIKSYETSLKRLMTAFDDEEIDLNEIDDVVERLNKSKKKNGEDYSLNTKKLIYAGILKYMSVMSVNQTVRDKWDRFYATIKGEVLEIEKKNELKEGEKEKYMDYSKMREQFTAYLEEVEYGEQDDSNWKRVITKEPLGLFLLANLLFLPAPTRLGNYRELKKVKATIDDYKQKIAEMDERGNYIVEVKMKTKTMYVYRFSEYKTADAIGNVIVNVENRLLKRVIATIMEEKWDVVVKASQSSQTKSLNSLTKKLFDKEFSVDIIRHAYITYLYSNKPTAKEKEQALRIFGNKYNPSQADLYYRKV